MKWGKCRFGSLKIDSAKYTRDVILDQGEVRKRKKKPSRAFREQFGHTPVSLKEEIPWQCKRLPSSWQSLLEDRCIWFTSGAIFRVATGEAGAQQREKL